MRQAGRDGFSRPSGTPDLFPSTEAMSGSPPLITVPANMLAPTPSSPREGGALDELRAVTAEEAMADESADRYSLAGPERAKAIAAGLAGAEWYHAPISRAEMKALMRRSDGPALRDTLLWILLLAVTGILAY